MIFLINKEKATDNVILFLHLPKCAGTTFQRIISNQKRYSPDFCIQRGGEIVDLPAGEENRLEVLYGHMLFGVHNKLPQKNVTYITFLRNPVARVISFFYYLQSENNVGIEVRDWFRTMTLFDYVSDEKFNCSEDLFPESWTIATDNAQTRILAGTMEADLDTAKNNLKKYFSIVGITERFEESLRIVEKNLGWEINSYENANVTPYKPPLEDIPDNIIEIIKLKNEKDTALYQFANQLLDEQLNQYKNKI